MAMVGIVGHEASKFTPTAEAEAKALITTLVGPGDVVISGGCHLGGIDIWAEEFARTHGMGATIFKPDRLTWTLDPPLKGYKERNIRIAELSEIVHVIVVKTLPPSFQGMQHKLCYHCHTTSHVKSGGCWTGKYAQGLGKPAIWWEIDNGV